MLPPSSVGFGLLATVSLVAAFVGALAGMGGGVVLIPVLTLLGVDIKHVVALSMLSVIATSSGAASAHVRDHIANLHVGMFSRCSRAGPLALFTAFVLRVLTYSLLFG